VPWLRRLGTGFPLQWPGFEPRSGHVGFVAAKVALGQIFSKHFGFPCQSSFHQLLQDHHHLSSGASTIGQTVAAVPSGLSLTPLRIKKNKKPWLLHGLWDCYEYSATAVKCNISIPWLLYIIIYLLKASHIRIINWKHLSTPLTMKITFCILIGGVVTLFSSTLLSLLEHWPSVSSVLF
jgi:hypothetical protein